MEKENKQTPEESSIAMKLGIVLDDTGNVVAIFYGDGKAKAAHDFVKQEFRLGEYESRIIGLSAEVERLKAENESLKLDNTSLKYNRDGLAKERTALSVENQRLDQAIINMHDENEANANQNVDLKLNMESLDSHQQRTGRSIEEG